MRACAVVLVTGSQSLGGLASGLGPEGSLKETLARVCNETLPCTVGKVGYLRNPIC